MDGSHHTHTIHFIIVIVTLATSPPNFFVSFFPPAEQKPSAEVPEVAHERL